jgi:hypothetical protein
VLPRGLVCYIDRVNISVAAIAMQEEFGWSETVKGLVRSVFARQANGTIARRFHDHFQRTINKSYH